MSRIGNSISKTVRIITVVAVASVLLLLGMNLGQRTASQQGDAEIARVTQENDAAMASAQAAHEAAVAEAQAEVAALTAQLEGAQAEMENVRRQVQDAEAAGRPYAGIGAESREAYLASDGFEGDPKRQELMEWAAGLASGINVGRQLSEAPPVGLEPLAGVDVPAEIARFCEDGNAKTLAGAVIQVLLPAFRNVAEEADQ